MAEIPTPQVGLVIRYNYLWRDEQRRGRDEGIKDRPTVIVLLVVTDELTKVAAHAITHSVPDHPADAVPLPPATARRLGLDDRPHWIVTAELNLFEWPGPDLRIVPGSKPQTFSYGFLPYNLTKQLIARLRAAHDRKSIGVVKRDS